MYEQFVEKYNVYHVEVAQELSKELGIDMNEANSLLIATEAIGGLGLPTVLSKHLFKEAAITAYNNGIIQIVRDILSEK